MAAPRNPPPARKTASPLPTALLLAGGLLLSLLLMAAGALLWTAQGGGLRGALNSATATPTSTPNTPFTPTPDFRATRTAEDAATQVAYAAAVATLALETLSGTPATAGENGFLPVIVQGDGTPTALPQLPGGQPQFPAPDTGPGAGLDPAVLATAVALATLGAAPPPELAPATPTIAVSLPVIDVGATPTLPPVEQQPTPTPPATATPTETPTPTFTLAPPTPTATLFATPTPTVPFALSSMNGIIDRQNAAARVGPASFYTQTATINTGTQVTLLARDQTGEWVYLCCIGANSAAWVRGVSVRPASNPTLQPPLSTLDPNDVRWLGVRSPDASLTPVPSQPPPAAGDFAMYRSDRGNSGRVGQLPRLPLVTAWGNQAGLAGQSFTSGAVLAGNTVYAASNDGHLYAFDRDSGGQVWRFFLGEVVRATPYVDGAIVYVVTESGRLFALDNQGSSAAQRWLTTLGATPRGGILPAPGRLVLTTRLSDGERLMIIDRGNGAVLKNIGISGATSVAAALSAQTVYVASDLVRAYDLWSGELVWQSSESTQFSTAPLIMTPGVEAASELYVADMQGRLLAFDANTGVSLWAAAVGGTATGIAANSTTVFVSGSGFVRAYARARRSGDQLLWSAGTAGNVPGGPLVDETRVLVVSESGAIQYLDVVTGAVIAANVQAAPLGGPAAAVAPWLFAPGQNAVLYAAREGQ